MIKTLAILLLHYQHHWLVWRYFKRNIKEKKSNLITLNCAEVVFFLMLLMQGGHLVSLQRSLHLVDRYSVNAQRLQGASFPTTYSFQLMTLNLKMWMNSFGNIQKTYNYICNRLKGNILRNKMLPSKTAVSTKILN